MRRGALFAALGDGAALPAAQSALAAASEGWRTDPRCAALLHGLAEYGAGRAGEFFVDPAEATAAVEAFLAHMLPVLARHPLGQMPFRHGYDPRVSSLLLAREGRALLSLVAREPGRHERRAIGFDGGERCELVLAGSGRGQVIRRMDAALQRDPCLLAAGACVRLGAGDEALLVDEVETRLVSLRIDQLAGRPVAVREYALADGALLHQSAGDPQDSRIELALAVLGRMGRPDAAPAMAELARERAASDHLRWQALRECLALDSGAGLEALTAVARDPADSLNRPAGSLLDRLRAGHPEFAAMERA
ncbi:MAG: hypothetical protein P0Y56_04560 [Candidatus Andeanibacterium colombiense]|uniref:HEAT repeat domain-containing protein n=1 Tax=Candidatus Andeanibacterium colombiense TaxID=3121345 RepID=A0AAJ5XAF7_9SPHN|nr:MAG: hypothetical protein P0Y56_04560 [Sphingomonadaceae bacterium]